MYKLKEDDYDVIMKENRFRLFNLSNYYQNQYWLSEYDDIRDELIDYSSKKLVKPLSFTDSALRLYHYHDETVKVRNYFISKSRVDYYNGLLSEKNNAISVYEKLKQIDINQHNVYFVTIDYRFTNEFLLAREDLDSIKSIVLKFKDTQIFNSVDGLLVKYEVQYSVYNSLLYIIPHIHFLVVLPKTESKELIRSIVEFFRNRIPNTESNSIEYTEITYNDKSYWNLSSYITKDFYKYIFHFKDRANQLDSYEVPLPHKIVLLYHLNNFHFYNSYRSLKFNLFHR